MKRIVITENQAKNLVKHLVIEQSDTVVDPISKKEEDPAELDYVIYQINSAKYAVVGNQKLYTAKYDQSKQAWMPRTNEQLAPALISTVVPDERGELTFDILMNTLVDDNTRKSLSEGNRQAGFRGGRQPMQTEPMQGDMTDRLRFVSLDYADSVKVGEDGAIPDGSEFVPSYGTVALRKSAKVPTNTKTGAALEVNEFAEGAQVVSNKSCVSVKTKRSVVYYYFDMIGGIKGSPVESSTDKKAYYCMEFSNGSKKVQYATYGKSENPPDPKSFVGNNNIINAQGPYATGEEALKNCQVVVLPQVIPLGKYFADNVSVAKISKSDEGVKSLVDYFAAGGKLTGFRIVASASKVPAGCEEGQTKRVKNKKNETITVCSTMKWKDVKTYDGSAKGNNDDGTGNLQLTKARAFNLYKQLLNMFPQLEGIPYSLEALGAIGLPYVKDQDDPSDHKYAEFRKVDFIPTIPTQKK